MGAWGLGPFENDDGADFRYLAESDPTRVIADTLTRVAATSSDASLSATDAAYALAAATLVAAQVTNQPSGALDDDGQEWLIKHPVEITEELVDLARSALERITTSNELADMWVEQHEGDEYQRQIAKINNQLAWPTTT